MKEARNNPLRRPRLKSRTGCTQCKQRRIKCDEKKPVCQKCIDTWRTCSFIPYHPLPKGPLLIASNPVSSSTSQTCTRPSHSSPPLALSPRISQPPSNFSALDLEIFHYFTTTVAAAIVDYPAGIELFQTTAVKLAFKHPFLLHEVLSVAALQLSATNQHNPAKSKDYAQASNTHLAAALSLVLPEILNIGSHNCDACFIFGTIMFYHAWAAQDPSRPSTLFFASDETPVEGEPVLHTAPWIKLHFATRKNLDPIWPLLRRGSLSALFQPLGNLDPNREDPLDPMEKEVLDDLATTWHNPTSALSPEQKKILDKTLSQLCRVYSMINPKFNYNTGKVIVVMGWLSWVPDDFLKMLEMKLPEALLIGLYYCVCLNQLQHVWALKHKGKNLMETILGVLGRREGAKWERWTKWPVQQVLGYTNTYSEKTVH